MSIPASTWDVKAWLVDRNKEFTDVVCRVRNGIMAGGPLQELLIQRYSIWPNAAFCNVIFITTAYPWTCSFLLTPIPKSTAEYVDSIRQILLLAPNQSCLIRIRYWLGNVSAL